MTTDCKYRMLEIAELTGKQHFHLMRDIRKMEIAWEKVQGSKFGLSSRTYQLPNGGTKYQSPWHLQGYPKDGTCMDKNMWVDFSADIQNHQTA